MTKTIKDKAGMVVALLPMIDVNTAGEFKEVLQYIADNWQEYFTPPAQPRKDK